MSHRSIIASLQGRQITVVGGGVSGLCACKLLLARGATVRLSDFGPKEKVQPELLALPLEFEFGGHSDAILSSAMLVLSPGVDPRHSVLARAKAQGIPVIGETELAYCALSYRPRYIAITGTNGKTTTTALIGHIARAAGARVFVGGNIGEPLSTLALPGAERVDFAVLELSSYQCEGLISFDADVAVWLNLTPDHLERYESVAAYAAQKARLFALQSAEHTAILNDNDARVRKTVSAAKKVFFSTARIRESHYRFTDSALIGLHNRENQLAAAAAMSALGIDESAIQRGLDTFKGVEHRLEMCALLDGVSWYNDSKATNDDAAAKALAAVDKPVIWLAGGKDKGGGYKLALAAGKGKVKLAVLFGAAQSLIAEAIGDSFPVVCVETLADSVKAARSAAKPGDSVLLSPACSSFDQFRNYEERGRSFKTLVTEAS